jgi:hypothetical protein
MMTCALPSATILTIKQLPFDDCEYEVNGRRLHYQTVFSDIKVSGYQEDQSVHVYYIDGAQPSEQPSSADDLSNFVGAAFISCVNLLAAVSDHSASTTSVTQLSPLSDSVLLESAAKRCSRICCASSERSSRVQ